VSGGLPPASAIVLAGGRSTRFGRDKLAEPLAGRSLLDHPVAAVAAVAREVLILGRAAAPGAGDAVDGVPIRHVADAEPYAGPLVALRTGLEQVREPLALVVGGDMPGLVPDVLALLLRTLASTDAAAAACLVHRGRRQPMPVALRVGAGTQAVGALVGAGERRLQALLERLATRELDEAEWRPLDPAAATLQDVDEPGDLAGWR
jgi:molybdopterin-guanine dinucleotide biosynthesis protein A